MAIWDIFSKTKAEKRSIMDLEPMELERELASLALQMRTLEDQSSLLDKRKDAMLREGPGLSKIGAYGRASRIKRLVFRQKQLSKWGNRLDKQHSMVLFVARTLEVLKKYGSKADGFALDTSAMIGFLEDDSIDKRQMEVQLDQMLSAIPMDLGLGGEESEEMEEMLKLFQTEGAASEGAAETGAELNADGNKA